MIQKIKDLMQTKELIDEINKKVSDHSDGVNSLQKELAELNTQLAGIKGSQTEFLTNFKDNLDVITDSKESLKKELYDFRLLKSQLQKTIMDKFERELDDELKVYSDKIKNDINEYNQLKDQMSSAVSQVKNISNEIAKLVDISKNIKKEDFELTKFSNQLKESDKEKLELMRKVDSLERLISKMRRQR